MNKKLMALITTILAVLAVIFWFLLPSFGSESMFGTTEHTFLDLTFGKTTTILGQEVEIFGFSSMNLIALILLALGALISVLSLLNVKIFGKANTDGLIMVICLVAAAVLFFFTRSFAVVDSESARDNLVLLSGAYLVMGLSLVGAIVTVMGEIFLSK